MEIDLFLLPNKIRMKQVFFFFPTNSILPSTLYNSLLLFSAFFNSFSLSSERKGQSCLLHSFHRKKS